MLHSKFQLLSWFCAELLTQLSAAVADLTASWIGAEAGGAPNGDATGDATQAAAKPAKVTRPSRGNAAQLVAKARAKARPAARQTKRAASAKAATAAAVADAPANAVDVDKAAESTGADAASPTASHVFRIPKRPPRPPSPGATARLAAAEAAEKAAAEKAFAAADQVAQQATAAAARAKGGSGSAPTGLQEAHGDNTPAPAFNTAMPVLALNGRQEAAAEAELDCDHLPLLPGTHDAEGLADDPCGAELLPPGFAADLLDLGAAEFEDLDLGMFMRPFGEFGPVFCLGNAAQGSASVTTSPLHALGHSSALRLGQDFLHFV